MYKIQNRLTIHYSPLHFVNFRIPRLQPSFESIQWHAIPGNLRRRLCTKSTYQHQRSRYHSSPKNKRSFNYKISCFQSNYRPSSLIIKSLQRNNLNRLLAKSEQKNAIKLKTMKSYNKWSDMKKIVTHRKKANTKNRL